MSLKYAACFTDGFRKQAYGKNEKEVKFAYPKIAPQPLLKLNVSVGAEAAVLDKKTVGFYTSASLMERSTLDRQAAANFSSSMPLSIQPETV